MDKRSDNHMTPADLRAITISLNDERGTGGQSRLARLLGWHHSTVWRKLNDKSPITESDALGACPRNRAGQSFLPLFLVSLDFQVGAHW